MISFSVQSPEDEVSFLSFLDMLLTSQPRKERIPWCVTNGVKWLFGMLQKTSIGYQSLHVDMPIVLDDEFTGLKDILKVLSVWVRISC